MSHWILPVFIALSTGWGSAQPTIPSLQKLLPDGAEIVETANLTTVVGKPRMVVLWMLRPQRYSSKNRNGGDCSDIVTGDFGEYRKGPTRLSLIDAKQASIVNTIEIRAGCDQCEDSFEIPLCVLTSTSGNPGTSNLELKDLTGEGLRADFSLFIFEAYGLVSTGAFGYDPKSDMVVQYPIQIGRNQTLWTEQVFAQAPLRPGYWRFKWARGHGDDSTYLEEVRFSRVRREFIQKQRRTR
jgi:hypothetical protein